MVGGAEDRSAEGGEEGEEAEEAAQGVFLSDNSTLAQGL